MPPAADLEVLESHRATVGGVTVRRALPRRARRCVGAWCFADHIGPAEITRSRGADIGPHPHIGLHTVTWLLAGEILHRDSLGSEQRIRPGELNLMTAGAGVSHSEESTGDYDGELHGVQLWIAQPESTRHGAAAFEHHAELPVVGLTHGTGTVLVGTFAGVPSPARRDTDLVGIELSLRAGRTPIVLEPGYEHALVVLDGALALDGKDITPGHLAYLGPGHDSVAVDTSGAVRAVLLGGVPFPEEVLMWWNFVGRTREEITAAYDQWVSPTERASRFGRVASTLSEMYTDPPPWAAPESEAEPR